MTMPRRRVLRTPNGPPCTSGGGGGGKSETTGGEPGAAARIDRHPPRERAVRVDLALGHHAQDELVAVVRHGPRRDRQRDAQGSGTSRLLTLSAARIFAAVAHLPGP